MSRSRGRPARSRVPVTAFAEHHGTANRSRIATARSSPTTAHGTTRPSVMPRTGGRARARHLARTPPAAWPPRHSIGPGPKNRAGSAPLRHATPQLQTAQAAAVRPSLQHATRRIQALACCWIRCLTPRPERRTRAKRCRPRRVASPDGRGSADRQVRAHSAVEAAAVASLSQEGAYSRVDGCFRRQPGTLAQTSAPPTGDGQEPR